MKRKLTLQFNRTSRSREFWLGGAIAELSEVGSDLVMIMVEMEFAPCVKASSDLR